MKKWDKFGKKWDEFRNVRCFGCINSRISVTLKNTFKYKFYEYSSLLCG